MTAGPWLTIVTVIKDDPEGLERTLASLSGCSLDGVEHLIIDSSADRAAVPTALAASGPALDSRVEWTEPAGVYAAMNTGLAEAHGTYVLFLNAGDELTSCAALDAVRTAIAGSPVWAFGDAEIVAVDGSSVTTPPWEYEAEKAAHFSRGHFPPHQSTVVRRDALRSLGGFDASYRIVADYAAALALSQVADPVRVPAVIARFHEGGVSTTGWGRSLREFHRARVSVLAPAGSAARAERLATMRQFVAMAAHRSPWPLVGVLSLLVWLVMGLTGVSWGSSLALTLMVLAQGIAGALWWRMLRPARSVPVLEAVGMGLGLGTAGAMIVGLWSWWWLFVVLSFAAWLVVRRQRASLVLPSIAPLAPLNRPDVLALLVGLIPGLGALLLALRSYPLTWVGEFGGYHGDMPFFEALAASVARLGPGASIFMDGASLKYHSLVYGWAGQLTLTVHAEPFVVLTRLLPLVGMIAAIALAAAWTRHFTRAWWAPALAVGLVITGGFVGATYGSVLNMDSPSQTMGAVWLLALSVMLLQTLGRVSLWWHLLPIVVLVIALTGGKVSTVAVAAAAFGLVVLVALVRREEWWRRALVVALVAGVALVITYLWLLAGSANAGGLRLFTLLDRASSVQGLNPVVTPRGIVAGIVLLLLAVIPRWAGLAWLVGERASRWSPSTVYGVGLVLGGLAPIAVLSGGFNDLWFAVAAAAPLAVLSAAGVARAVEWLGPAARRRVLLAGVLGLICSVLVAALWASGSTGIIGNGWRWAGPVAGIGLAVLVGVACAVGLGRPRVRAWVALTIIALVTMALPSRVVYAAAEPLARQQEGSLSTVLFALESTYVATLDQDREITWTSDQAAAGAWLRANAGPDDLVATNLTLGALVPSLTRLTTYISDIHIQAPYSVAGDLPLIAEREAQSWAFINEPSESSFAPLCAAGVTWIWVDTDRAAQVSWEPYATVRWEGPGTKILSLERSSCPS